MAESRIDELRRRLEREPGSRLFAQLAEELRRAGDGAEAIRICRAGLAAHPAYPSARLTLGRALLDAGDRKGARTELTEAVRLAPDSIVGRRVLGQVLDELSDLPAALEQYAAALRLAPDDVALRVRIRELALRIAPPESAADDGTPRGGQLAAVGGEEAAAATVEPKPEATAEPESAKGGPGAPVAGPAAPGAVQAVQAVAVSSAGGREAPETAAGELWEELAAAPAGAAPAEGSDLAEERPGDEEAGAGDTPFSSSTLAELYLRQGLHQKAVEVYRHVLEADPSNGRARARLVELSAVGTTDEPGAGVTGGTESRKRAIERTIAGLEALLAVLRRP